MVSQEGLRDQLLDIFVGREYPKLEAENRMMTLQCSKNKKSLLEAEQNMLHALTNCRGNLLDNVDFALSMDNAKRLSDEIVKTQKAAELRNELTTEVREIHRSFALHASVLFLSLAELPKINSMYQYSLGETLHFIFFEIYKKNLRNLIF
jgi:hypothetical protein